MQDVCTEAKLAKLFIPGPDESKIALEWRLSLIKKENIPHYDELADALIRMLNDSLDNATKSHLAHIASSESMILDEVEHGMLLMTTHYLRANSVDIVELFSLDRDLELYTMRKSRKLSTNEYLDRIEWTRREQLRLGNFYLKLHVPKIRAKLAFQECVAMIAPDKMVPHLVSTSTKYLACPFILDWIQSHRHQIQYGKGSTRKTSRDCILSLNKSIIGDSRSYQRRRYSYWSLTEKYEFLTKLFKSFRKQYREKKLESGVLLKLFRGSGISEIYFDLVLNSKKSLKQIALETMTDQRQIGDPKAFKDFQPRVSKLRKKHLGAEVIVEIQDFIDRPLQFPELFADIDYMSALERVRL